MELVHAQKLQFHVMMEFLALLILVILKLENVSTLSLLVHNVNKYVQTISNATYSLIKTILHLNAKTQFVTLDLVLVLLKMIHLATRQLKNVTKMVQKISAV
jgi:hypothetical protein